MVSAIDPANRSGALAGVRLACSSLQRILCFDAPTLTVLGLVFAPWITVAFLTAGIWGALNFLGYAIVILAAGYGIMGFTVSASARPQALVFAPAVGILAVSSLTALWVRLGLPLMWSLSLWSAFAVAGLFFLWRDRTASLTGKIRYGLMLAVISALISVVYFLPSASNDIKQRQDGSYSWMFIDAQHFHAIAASIKESGSPPATPGTATGELLYHFAPYAPAAVISRLDGLELGDALVRVTRGASIWSLLLSCFGLGTILSLKANGGRFGGIMSVAGLFFYGSLLAFFDAEKTSLGNVAGALLFQIPRVKVPGDGGPFEDLLCGHSVVHGLVAITAILGLCLIERASETAFSPRHWILLALPALAAAVNLEASLYCFGSAAVLLLWDRLGNPRSWLSVLLMSLFFYVCWSIMGYAHSSDAGSAATNMSPEVQWWPLAVWFIVGLGFRLIALRWISPPFKDPVSVLVLVTLLGWLSFWLLIHLRDSNEKYGIYFLQSLLSIFAFSRLKANSMRGDGRPQMMADWLKLARNSMVVLLACAVVTRVALYAMHSPTWTASLRLQILPYALLLLLIIGALAVMKRRPQFAAASSAIAMAVVAIGFLAWVPTWIRFSLQTVPTSVNYPSGEVRGLRQLGQLMGPGERFATNKHSIDLLSPLPPLAVSYGYSALSERPVLLEGYLARGEKALPWFDTLFHDNELLFSTRDPETLRSIAKTWKVRWLVARPGTDVAIPRPLPSWLTQQQNCGDLKIYRID